MFKAFRGEVLQKIVTLDDDECALFLKKIEDELSHVLDDDVADVVKLFSTLPSYDKLIAHRIYIRYKIRTLHNQKLECELSSVNAMLELIKQAQMSSITSSSSKGKKRPLLERSASIPDEDVPPPTPTPTPNWF